MVENENLKTNVTALVRHLSCEAVQKCLSYLDIKEITPVQHAIDIPTKVAQQKTQYETVSEITAIAITWLWGTETLGKYRFSVSRGEA